MSAPAKLSAVPAGALPPERGPAGAMPHAPVATETLPPEALPPETLPPDARPVGAGPCGRRAVRRAERRAAIVAVARRAFLDHGYAATTMSEIAGQLGGSKATLWSYFRSKELLFAAVVARAAQAFHTDLAREIGAARLETALTDYARRFVRNAAAPDNLALYRLIVAEAGRFPEIGRMFLDGAASRTQGLLAQRLAAAMAAGELCPGDPGQAAEQLLALCRASCYQHLLFGQDARADAAALDADARAAVAVFLRAYAPAAGARAAPGPARDRPERAGPPG